MKGKSSFNSKDGINLIALWLNTHANYSLLFFVVVVFSGKKIGPISSESLILLIPATKLVQMKATFYMLIIVHSFSF